MVDVPVDRMAGFIVSSVLDGEDVRFFVVNQRDVIQSVHAAGRFYEPEELAIITDFFPPGGVFVDIGANIGNHSIFVAKYLHPAQIIAFEPNPAAIRILTTNLLLNGLQRIVDLSHLGVGLSDGPGQACAFEPADNLGGTRFQIAQRENGLRLMPGDAALAQRRVDFIKIDVEGMELRVLDGLAATIARWRPPLFVEVEDDHAEAFRAWTQLHHYVTVRTYRRYAANENYMLLPVEAQSHGRTAAALRETAPLGHAAPPPTGRHP